MPDVSRVLRRTFLHPNGEFMHKDLIPTHVTLESSVHALHGEDRSLFLECVRKMLLGCRKIGRRRRGFLEIRGCSKTLQTIWCEDAGAIIPFMSMKRLGRRQRYPGVGRALATLKKNIASLLCPKQLLVQISKESEQRCYI